MTQKISVLTLSVQATTAIPAERLIAADGSVADLGGNAIGAACAAASVGMLIPCDVLGTTVVVASGAVAKGAAIEVGADGMAAAKTTGVTVGRALQSAATAGERIEILLIPN